MVEAASPFIPDEKVREIREACSIVEVISDYVSLKKAGVNYKGLCPFHGEKTPSFCVNENRKFFHCFGCGVSGDVFTFLMKHDNLSFVETVRLLARRCGIHLPEKPLSPQEQKRAGEREECFQVNQAASAYYHNLLMQDKRGAEAKRYVLNRGISADTAVAFQLGFAPDSWDGLVTFFKNKKLSLAAAHKVGLISSRDGGQYYDRFRNRVIFPIFNISQQVIGFGGRVIGDGEPKYLNSPESIIYNKRNNLYGLHLASKPIQKEQQAIIVEGYLDLLSLHQAGIQNSVAALGTALTEQHIRILKRYTDDIVTVFDADPSGERAMVRSLEPFLKSGVSPKLVLLPQGEDPDSFVRQHGGAAFTEKTGAAERLLDFVIERSIQKHNLGTPRGKVGACDDTLPLLEMISDGLERELYVQKVSRRIGVSESHLRARRRSGEKRENDASRGKQQGESPLALKKNAEIVILKLMVSHPDIIWTVEREGLLEEFFEAETRELAFLLCKTCAAEGALNLTSVMEALSDERLKAMLAAISFQEDVPDDPAKALEDCIRNIRLKKNSTERKRINLLLKQAEALHDESASVKYQHLYLQLVEEQKRISRFKLNAMKGEA